ncbi:hypothetical protein [Roseofilum casamattae]|uniref:Uncharacterized protein n=1 Tax=Roseofilum casamattae BLCC-M143 TaxID=3022442 RepID=A0ABT7BYT4_9CYAN|nr:hypothetical protein [Roseofilum casamattae]MDJ1183649.1 hypothetical protein [Roseofilum casamattae BLCC-M143]
MENKNYPDPIAVIFIGIAFAIASFGIFIFLFLPESYIPLLRLTRKDGRSTKIEKFTTINHKFNDKFGIPPNSSWCNSF